METLDFPFVQKHLSVQFWEVISGEHGIGPDGAYEGTDPQQLERLVPIISHKTLAFFI